MYFYSSFFYFFFIFHNLQPTFYTAAGGIITIYSNAACTLKKNFHSLFVESPGNIFCSIIERKMPVKMTLNSCLVFIVYYGRAASFEIYAFFFGTRTLRRYTQAFRDITFVKLFASQENVYSVFRLRLKANSLIRIS